MTEHDTDIEFDFFDEPETRETQPRRPPPRRSGPRRPTRPTGLTPLLRLIGLIAFAILIVVLLVFWAQSCRASSRKNSYKHYVEKVSAIAAASQRDGGTFTAALTTAGSKASDVESQLTRLARQETLNVEQARELNPPGRLADEHLHMIEALQFRVSGLTGLAGALRQTVQAKTSNALGVVLSQQAARLLASDVIWDDRFKDPAKEELKRQGIGVRVPDSTFLANPELASERSMTQVLARLRTSVGTGPKTSGPRGTNLVSVKVVGGKALSPSSETTIVATTKLAFEVTVEDSGQSQEVQIPVTLTIEQRPTRVVKRSTIDLINPGEQKTVTFKNFRELEFGRPITIKIEVTPVQNEKTTSNNSATYPVLFSYPG